MKIRLEIPRVAELPSQGRNPGSIPGGSAIVAHDDNILLIDQRVNAHILRPRGFYRAWLDSDNSDGEFVFFVGWLASNNLLVFEDGHGDLHSCAPHEIEVV